MRQTTESSQHTQCALIKVSENLWQQTCPKYQKSQNADEGCSLPAIAQTWLSILANTGA
jgi:hypothetical protein